MILSPEPVLVLTGATGRFGSAFIERYGHIYRIVGIARHIPAIAPRNWKPLQADVCGDAETIVGAAMAVHGRVDIWVNAAVRSTWTPFPELSAEELALQLATNVTAPYALAAALLRQSWMADGFRLNTSRNRSILHISSIAGAQLFAGRGRGAYSTSKAALNMLTRHMAHDCRGHGIRVNALAPNSFPGYLSAEAVCDAAHALLQGTDSGTIRIQDLQYIRDEK